MEHWFELAGGLFGAAVTYFMVGMGMSAAGRYGVLTLIVAVPGGVGFGYLLAKLLTFIRGVLSEDR